MTVCAYCYYYASYHDDDYDCCQYNYGYQRDDDYHY